MIYNNLIYLVVVIFILTTNSIPEKPLLGVGVTALLFTLKTVIFFLLVTLTHRGNRINRASDYFSAELKLSILAIISLAMDVYFLDCQYYFALLPGAASLPVITNFAGVLLFFFYLCLIWHGARRNYGYIFGRYHSSATFIKTNLKNNIPTILPWLILSLLADCLMLLPFPAVKNILQSAWGEPVFFFVFFILLSITFPEIIRYLWGCKSMEQGTIRRHIEEFSRQQELKYADILIWPLFEGLVLTAGVMGLIGRFRYILFTPALLRNLTFDEIDAVMAHEIGHVKRYHLQLYIFLLLGFSLIAQLGSYLFMYALLKSNYFYEFSAFLGKKTDTVLIFISTFALLLLLIFYFRFIFGFFMRNFERQADLHALESMGSSQGIIDALEKVAWLSGNIRELPSWHHFGIAERVDFLNRCGHDRGLIRRHHRKVYGALLLYMLVLIGTGFTLWKMPDDLLQRAPLDHLTRLYQEKTREEPQNFLWYQLLGDLQQERKYYAEAVASYEKGLQTVPDNADILNNLAWVLLIADDPAVRDPQRALDLALKAVSIKSEGYVWDTLALAYWQNGLPDKAIKAETQAIIVDPENRQYYEKQMGKYILPGSTVR